MATPLAGPMADCCFSPGVKHTGTAIGITTEIADVPTYLSEPPASSVGTGPKKVIFFFSDIHGPFFLNNQLLQDYFASHGFYVAGIDYFLGDPLDLENLNKPDFNREAWRAKAFKQAQELTPKWVEGLRTKYGSDAKYCAVGYCFGAPYAVELAATDKLVAAAFAHPSALSEEQFASVTKPLFLSCAETDRPFPAEARRKAEDMLVAAKKQYCIQVFSGVSHGFAVRGNPDVPDERWAKEESARGIIGWFSRFSCE
ncbi:Alpha/Beta hydrolase protein [Mycena floridula]|nr:Alpha/Beta hydrolase protein [Mycena floridula]